jgi:hypothetical protein
MRLLASSLLIGCTALLLPAPAQATSWTSAKFPGEADRAVQGCAEGAQNPGDWFCIIIRCDRPGAPLSLHFSAAGPDIHGDIKLVVDEDTFPVKVPESVKSPLPWSTRAEALPYALVDAMKAGSMISVRAPICRRRTIEFPWRTHAELSKRSSGRVRVPIPAPQGSGGASRGACLSSDRPRL